MGRTDGRTVAPMRVYLATLPQRNNDKKVLVRVLRETPRYLAVRLTALPGDPQLRQRQWSVPRTDLDTMISTGLARAIASLPCNLCTGRLTVQHAQRGKVALVVLACSNCEQAIEV